MADSFSVPNVSFAHSPMVCNRAHSAIQCHDNHWVADKMADRNIWGYFDFFFLEAIRKSDSPHSVWRKMRELRIGILTFHSQLNYGGVLQCWALQTVLEKMGHEVVVIDRWLHSDNRYLECGFNKWRIRFWAKFLFRAMLGLGDWAILQRVKKTKRFINEYLHLTPCHFVEWKDAPKNIGIDLLVVGSDQVWHCGDWGDPRAYLLEGAPQIPAIAYAASFGMASLPEWTNKDKQISSISLYKDGLKRFRAISCRETEGVTICRSLGFDATHVVDPTLLAWLDGEKAEKKNEIVCYFMSEPIADNIDELAEFAKRNRCTVKILTKDPPLLPIPKSVRMLVQNRKRNAKIVSSNLQIMASASPAEFFDAFKTAKYVISDSFHALMFSICFDCNVRILRPKSEFRKTMFARIEEFANHANGNLLVDTVHDALGSFNNGMMVEFDRSWLTAIRQDSLSWLQNAIA